MQMHCQWLISRDVSAAFSYSHRVHRKIDCTNVNCSIVKMVLLAFCSCHFQLQLSLFFSRPKRCCRKTVLHSIFIGAGCQSKLYCFVHISINVQVKTEMTFKCMCANVKSIFHTLQFIVFAIYTNKESKQTTENKWMEKRTSQYCCLSSKQASDLDVKEKVTPNVKTTETVAQLSHISWHTKNDMLEFPSIGCHSRALMRTITLVL